MAHKKRLSPRPKLAFEILDERLPLAAEFVLTKDINTQGTGSGTTQSIVAAGSDLFFAHYTTFRGTELWKSDGTVEGTGIVKDINPGSSSAFPQFLTEVNGLLFFSAVNTSEGQELWRTDGTANGTIMIANAATAGTSSSSPLGLVNVSGTLFFTATDVTNGRELWKVSPGATQATLVKDIQPGSAGSAGNFTQNLTNVNGTLYFSAETTAGGRELWKSDGTTAGTVMVKDIIAGSQSGSPSGMFNVNGTLFFIATSTEAGAELWKSDGTLAGTVMISDSCSGTCSIEGFSYPAVMNGQLYFVGGSEGKSLWKSDGTASGTFAFTVLPGAFPRPRELINVNNTLFFSAENPDRELWKSDGTSAGTTLVKDIDPSGSSSFPRALVNVNGVLYFRATGSFFGTGYEVWRSDGTVSGTFMLADIAPGSGNSVEFYFTAAGLNGRVYFPANSSSTVPEKQWGLWRTDGTSPGAEFVTSLPEAPGHAVLSTEPSPVVVNDTLYFSGNDGSTGGELWKSDGTTTGTVLVKEIQPGIRSGTTYPTKFFNFNGSLYFSASDGAKGLELWKSDGTNPGTFILKDINASGNSNPSAFVGRGSTLFFAADEGAGKTSLWKTDGTTAGTQLVKNLRGSTSMPYISHTIEISGSIYFLANSAPISSGYPTLELWKSDGTTAGTVPIRSFGQSSGRGMINFNGMLYFTANDGSTGEELWRSDGTLAGTTLVRDVNPTGRSNPRSFTIVNGVLYFSALDATSASLWKSDGTTAGTTLVKRFGRLSSLTNVNGNLFFEGHTGSRGNELWKSDGTTAGTVLVKEINPPTSDYGDPRELINLNGKLYFLAKEQSIYQLWTSDGTTAGTLAVVDPTGARTPEILTNTLTAFNGLLYYVGNSEVVGRELFYFGSTDYGDSPVNTTYASDGPRHVAVGPMLGSLRDTNESDGLASATANGDDSNGLDDEDAFAAPPALVPGENTTIDVVVGNADAPTRLSTWIDWNNDGDFTDAGEQVVNSEVAVTGNNRFSFTVPTNVSVKQVVARIRVSNTSNLASTGFAPSGEVEDHLLPILFNQVVILPNTSNNIIVRRVNTDLRVIDGNTSTTLASAPLSELNTLRIVGATDQNDTIWIDYATGGFFGLPGGIEMDGQGGTLDTFRATGRGTSTAAVHSQVAQSKLNFRDSAIDSPVIYRNFETLTIEELQSFEAIGSFDIGNRTFNIGSATPVILGTSTTISNGLMVADSVALGASATLAGAGRIDANFSAAANSTIALSGDLQIGKASSALGFDSRGSIVVNQYTLSLLDANDAHLGSTTSIGSANASGTIISNNGLTIDVDSTISGYGLIQTPNESSKPLSNQGTIRGSSTSRPLTMTGFVQGLGSLDQVELTGTHNPANNEANLVTHGTVRYSGNIVAELGGIVAGTQYDQFRHTGPVQLGGVLDVRLLGTFVPPPSNAFAVLTSTAEITGTFASVNLPLPPAGKTWRIAYTSQAVLIEVVELTLTFDSNSMSERNGTIQATIRRSDTDNSQPLLVTLSSSDPSEATVPAMVTIPANQSSVTFAVTAVDDSLLDGPQTVTITASAGGYSSSSSALTVTDFETVEITTIISAISENGGVAVATITRSNTDRALAVSVTLTNSDPSELTIPTSVIIPADQASVTFPIVAVDDDLLDGTQTVGLSAAATGYVSGAVSIDVTDVESLSLAIDTSSISESGGSATGTVSRNNSDIALPITVTLTSSDLSEATVPSTVTIPANQPSATFTISAVDDSLLDGTQTVTVTAWSTGYMSDAKSLNVTDAETLSISFVVASISENGGTATGTVTRSNTDIAQPLIVTLTSGDQSEATVPATVTILANQTSASFVVTAVDDNLLDGSQAVAVTAVAAGYQSGSATITVTDSETVAIAIDKSSISEFGGSAIGTVTRSNTDIASPITVNLTNSDSSELSVPATVTIPANLASVTFSLTAVDDSLLDGTQSVTIGANSAGYFGSTTSIAVTDYESIVVTLDKLSIAENGETVIATVTRSNTDRAVAITVTLTNSDPSEAVLQNTVTIPANQASANFAIAAVDDTLLDGTQIVTVTTSAPGYVSGSKAFDVTDVELLTLTIDKLRISENGGTATGTVTRGNTDIGLPITVNLSSSDTTEATVPATVTIPANQSSATFTITGVPDHLLDGTQSVSIVASSTGYFSDLESIDVTDAETFTVTFDKSSISESGGTAIGTVTRSNTDTTQSVVVSLTSNDPSEATVPSSVTIPAGQASTTFAVTAVDDNLLDGDQLVTITASATQYLNGIGTITVADSETLALVINAPSISENGGTTTGRVTRSNTDIAQPLVITLSSSDTSEAVVPNAVTIPANQSFVVFTITAVDDTLLDGTQSVSVSASATGYLGSSKSLQVTDAESLSVSINVGAINESGGTAIGTVTRSNTDIAQPITVNLTSSLTSEATVPATVTIPANATAVTFAITAVDDGVLDGTKTVLITASSQGYADGSRTIDVTDSVILSLSMAASSISETGGSTIATVSRSNSNTNLPLTVQLLSSDITEAAVPATITIPANQSSVNFTVTAVDDTLLDGTQSVSITASAAGYQSGTRSLEVTDAESLTISTSLTSISENGGTTTGTVTRSNSDNAQPLIVTLISNDTSEVDVPNSVTIPANQASATFIILALDDTLLDGKQSALITASATGYANGTRTIEVTDSESLTVSIDAASISEFGGTAIGTVTRSNTDRNLPLTVALQSSDTSEANVPVSVTIPAGQASATFAITAADDALLDGSQAVVIEASATGYSTGSQPLNVTDFETISVVLSVSTISENGGSAIATVGRSNTDNSQAITVTLLSSDTSEATVPATVVIPANQASISFLVTAVDDTLLDGTQPVTVTASSPGYASDSQALAVTDAESLAVTIDATSISENGGLANGTVTRSNTDIGLPIVVILSSGDTSEATVPASVTIPAGQASATFAIAAVDDAALDGSQAVAIEASATGYSTGSQTLNVTDFETITVVLSLSAISENGGSTTATVTRSNTDNSQAITVALLTSDTSEATVPATVVIPANQASISFVVTGVDDTLLDGTRAVTVTASSPGYVSGSQALAVTDAESLAVTIDATSISENGGLTNGTVTRSNTDIGLPFVVTLASDNSSEAIVAASVTIPAGQASATFSITAVDDALLDGSQAVAIAASATGYSSGTQTLNVTDFETISVVLTLSTISENSGSTTATVTRSNTDNSQAITVTLLSSDTSEATVPTTVVIPANQDFISFVVTAVDDTLLDGTQAVTVTASSPGYLRGSHDLSVTDSETLTLAIDATSISESGGLANGTVTRSNTDRSSPLTVILASSDTSEATVPLTLTIPANQSSVTFPITAVDDNLLDGLQPISLSATAVGYTSAPSTLDVTDAETVSLAIDVLSMNEKGGKASGIVTRSNTDIGLPLTVILQINDTTEASVPTSVIIPANASSVSFAIDAVDDALLDGTQTASIQVIASNYTGSAASLNVTDSESLSITINVSSMIEKNGVAIGTVSRSNTDTALALVVQLVSNDTTEATVPASVIIPANQSQVTFTITSVNDHLIDGNQTVQLIASASDYESGSASLIVRDDDPNFPWQNPRNRFDVNNDGQVSPIDALLVINAINVRMVLTPELPDPFIPVRYVDVSGDGLLSPIDALLVINELNRMRNSGEGESNTVAPSLPPSTRSNPFEAVIDLLAEDQYFSGKRKRL